MPTLNYRVEAPGVNILKTVSDQVIAGLLDELDLTTAFQNAVYPVSSFMASSQYDDGQGAIKMVGNRCDVDIAYVMDSGQVPWPVDSRHTLTARRIGGIDKGHHTPLLVDSDAGILIEYRTKACAVEMNFSLTFETFDEATRAFDTIQSKYRGNLVQNPFDLAFSFPVSMGLYKYLVAVYRAKTAYRTRNFLDYINATKQTEISFDVRKSQLDRPDADKELMVRCQQLNCLAQLTMDQKEPEAQKVEKLSDAYVVAFGFVVQFGRPDSIAVHTPISVDNTLLPYGLFESVLGTYHNNPATGGVYQDLMVSEFMRRSYGQYNHAHQVTRMPVYDDWWCVDKQYVFYDYRPLLIAHFTLDGPQTVINLNQLGQVALHPIVLDILKSAGAAAFDYGGLFTIGVYADTLRLGKELLRIDADLNLTITSNRPDKVYHLVLSESTDLTKMTADWDALLLKYRYFFPLTIERNLQALIAKKYLKVDSGDALLGLISRLLQNGSLKAILNTMVALGEDTYELFSYTQNPAQLADYMAYTPSKRRTYQLPAANPSDPGVTAVRAYYTTKASPESRSLLVAFLEQNLLLGNITLDLVPDSYLDPNRTIAHYWNSTGGFYGFNTPFRILNTTVTV